MNILHLETNKNEIQFIVQYKLVPFQKGDELVANAS
jgi:hypothetical protein